MFKLKIDPKQISALEEKVKKDVQEILSAPAVLNEVGKTVVDRIRYQARTEDPFNSRNQSFPALKPSTIKHREYLARYNKTHPTFDSSRSNLTITGAFQESLTYEIKGPGLIEFYFDGVHPGYRGANGPLKKQDVTNEQLYGYLKKKGFVLFDNSIQENQTLVSRVRAIVLRFIRRGLSVRNS